MSVTNRAEMVGAQYLRPMATRNPRLRNSSLRTLQWVSLVIGVLLTALALYDLSNGERSISVWVALVCWPIVAIASIVQLVRLRRAQ